MSKQNNDTEMTGADIAKIIINLVVIYAIGGMILATVYAKTSPVIFTKAKQEKEERLKQMMPEADSIEKTGEWPIHHHNAGYYTAKKGGEAVGYIVETFGKGYSSYINTLIALDPKLVLQKIDVVSQKETPGLGDEVEVPAWKEQFKGKTLDTLKVVKDGDQKYIQAISGATISSRAVTDDRVGGGVRGGVQMITDVLSGKAPAQPAENAAGGHH
ncbi:MAG: RnfABCDGE type electron transport complex subunit G [Nitrospirae bacterium]|nr:RnfABCDGE type electron transport complex subunit G [Nitrospirota bacterium]